MGLVARQTLKASVANYMGVAIGFINVVFLMPLIFDQTEVGILSMLTGNMVLLGGLAMLGITSSMYRYYPYFKSDPKDNLNGFDFWIAVIPFTGFALLALTLVLTQGWVVAFFDEKASEFLEYYVLLLPLVFSHTFFSVFEAATAIEGRIVVPKLLKEVLLRGFTTLAFFSYYLGWTTFNQSVLLLIVFHFIPLAIVFFYFSRLRKLHFKPNFSFVKKNPGVVKDFFRYTSFVTIGSISGLLLTKLDMIMISAEMGLEYTAIYAIAFHVATVIEIPRRALTQMLSPKISEYMKDSRFKETEDLYKRTSVLLYIPALFLLTGVLINLDNLYRIMPNGEEYASGKWVIIIIALSRCLEILTGMGQAIISYSRFYHITLVMTIGTTVLSALLNLWLIPVYGILGAAYSTGITLVVQQLIIIITIYTKLRFHSFTLPQLWITLIFTGVFLLNFLLPFLSNVWLDILVRSTLFLSLFVFVVYKSKLSEETNRLIDKVIQRVKDRNFRRY